MSLLDNWTPPEGFAEECEKEFIIIDELNRRSAIAPISPVFSYYINKVTDDSSLDDVKECLAHAFSCYNDGALFANDMLQYDTNMILSVCEHVKRQMTTPETNPYVMIRHIGLIETILGW